MIYLRKNLAAKKFVRTRLINLLEIILLLFCILIVRIAHLQILQGNHFRTRALQNSIQLIPIPAPRGMIFDRHGETLVKNRLSFNVGIVRGRLDEVSLEKTRLGLNRILGLPLSELKERFTEAKKSPFTPVIVAKNIDIDKVTAVEESRLNLPGVIIQVEPSRAYVFGDLACHLLGYVGEINTRELARLSKEGYEIRDIIGKSGLEKFYDRELRGKKGGKQVEVNVRGEKLRVLGLKPPIGGNNLVLTIDKEIQMKAEEALGENKGAVVVMEIDSGEILALASKPGFDPNLFVLGKKTELERLLMDPSFPFLNRTIQAQYPPGSIFKIVVTLAALENNLVNPKRTITCPGYYSVGGRNFRCWREGGHGSVELMAAIANSCNVYYYQLGLRVGAERSIHFAKLLGLGEGRGVDLPEEKPGFLPIPVWKKKTQNCEWYTGDTLNLTIGQGLVLTTPLQIASMLGAVANDGQLYRPYLVKKILTSDGELVTSFPPQLQSRIPISSQGTLRFLRQGLEGVVREGTGRASRLADLRVGGKTGTAQTSRGKSHAWFACFAPVESPKVVIVVLVEHGGTGGSVAAPIAQVLLKEVFKENNHSNLGED